jgi:putative hydrolase of the HAD superfamily
VKAVIFDLDDTLFDHTTSAVTALGKWVPELGAEWSDELIPEWFAIERVSYDGWLEGRLTYQGQRRARLQAFLPVLGRPVPAEDAELDEVFEGFLQHYRTSWSASPTRSPHWRLPGATAGKSAS